VTALGDGERGDDQGGRNGFLISRGHLRRGRGPASNLMVMGYWKVRETRGKTAEKEGIQKRDKNGTVHCEGW